MRLKNIDIKLIEAFGYSILKDGNIYKNGKRINGRLNNSGYLQVRLSLHKSEWFMIHRLVAAKYLPKVTGKPHVNHKDKDRLNNAVDNLEYCTHAENMQHAYKVPLTAREDARAIREATGASYADIAKFLGVSAMSVSNWCNNRDLAAIKKSQRDKARAEGRLAYNGSCEVIITD